VTVTVSQSLISFPLALTLVYIYSVLVFRSVKIVQWYREQERNTNKCWQNHGEGTLITNNNVKKINPKLATNASVRKHVKTQHEESVALAENRKLWCIPLKRNILGASSA
jgi:hypothetical protein